MSWYCSNLFELVLYSATTGLLRRYDEDCVISGHRSDHPVEVGPVDCRRDDLGRSRRRSQNHQLSTRLEGLHELVESPGQRRRRFIRRRLASQLVAIRFGLHRPYLSEIPGNGGLGHLVAAQSEQVQQLSLAGDRMLGDDAADEAPAGGGSGHRNHYTHMRIAGGRQSSVFGHQTQVASQKAAFSLIGGFDV